jgi:hypothetical protein
MFSRHVFETIQTTYLPSPGNKKPQHVIRICGVDSKGHPDYLSGLEDARGGKK